MNYLEKIKQQVQELENHIKHFDSLDKSVSDVNVGWHICHTLMACIGIIKALEKSNPKDYKFDFVPLRILVFTLGKIPRGKGKAPKPAQPKPTFTKENIEENLKNCHTVLSNIDAIPDEHFFKHHVFGNLKKAKTLKFITIHNEHHLKIIRDILKA